MWAGTAGILATNQTSSKEHNFAQEQGLYRTVTVFEKGESDRQGALRRAQRNMCILYTGVICHTGIKTILSFHHLSIHLLSLVFFQQTGGPSGITSAYQPTLSVSLQLNCNSKSLFCRKQNYDRIMFRGKVLFGKTKRYNAQSVEMDVGRTKHMTVTLHSQAQLRVSGLGKISTLVKIREGLWSQSQSFSNLTQE